MKFNELAAKRYSVRKYKETKIREADIQKILEAGRLAPTACNNQPQRIIAVSTAEGLEKLSKCTECHYGAPLAFIISYDENAAWKRSYDGKSSGDTDASIVATHMMLQAYELGIGSVWIMHFIPEAVITEFEFPENIVPSVLLYCGYPDEEPSPRHTSRRGIDEFVSYR